MTTLFIFFLFLKNNIHTGQVAVSLDVLCLCEGWSESWPGECNNLYILLCPSSYDYFSRVKSGIFGQTAKFGQRPCLFHVLNIKLQNK